MLKLASIIILETNSNDMKRKDILISLAIIATCTVFYGLYSFTNTLVHGYIELDSGDAVALLKIRGNFFSKDIEISNSEPAQINNRILRPQSLTISKIQNSNAIQLVSYGPWGDLSRIKIKNNETLSLKLGPPLIIKPKVVNYPGQVAVDFSVIGQAGEKYKIPRLSPAPKVKIMDENGNIIASGSFTYG